MDDVESKDRVEHVFKSKEEDDTSDRYFNGALVFKTKVVWFPNVVGLLIMNILCVYGWYKVFDRLFEKGEWGALVYGWMLGYFSGSAVSIGAHRLFTHKSYKVILPLRVILMILQTVAAQNSLYVWARDHRTHHKFSDTDADPHNSNRGFFFSHMGWLMMKKHPEVIRGGKTIDMSDLRRDPVVMFQYRYMSVLYVVFSIIIPSSIGYIFWDLTVFDALLYFYMMRYVTLLHITWVVNSIAHFYGTQPYDKKSRSRDSYLVSFITCGEGWHNYHHTFPWDYKAAESLWKLNISANVIKFFEFMGWAYDLKEASPEMIQRKIIKDGDSTFERRNIKFSEKGQEIMKMYVKNCDY